MLNITFVDSDTNPSACDDRTVYCADAFIGTQYVGNITHFTEEVRQDDDFVTVPESNVYVFIQPTGIKKDGFISFEANNVEAAKLLFCEKLEQMKNVLTAL